MIRRASANGRRRLKTQRRGWEPSDRCREFGIQAKIQVGEEMDNLKVSFFPVWRSWRHSRLGEPIEDTINEIEKGPLEDKLLRCLWVKSCGGYRLKDILTVLGCLVTAYAIFRRWMNSESGIFGPWSITLSHAIRRYGRNSESEPSPFHTLFLTTMTVVPEVLIFKAADEAEANKTLQEHYKSSNGGITKSYKGFTEEKPDTVVAVNLWAANPPATASTSSTYISHPALDAPDQLQLVLDSKVMEIVLISLKPEYDPVQVVGKLIERARAHEKTSGTTWGQDAKNGDDHFVAMLGWESSKEHFEVVGQGDFVPMINQFKESGKEITMYHVPLKESKLGA